MTVSCQTVMRWEMLRQAGGLEELRRAEHFGRPERLCVPQREELVRLVNPGSLASGFVTKLWRLPRIARLIEERLSIAMVPTSVRRLFGRLGWSVQRPSG